MTYQEWFKKVEDNKDVLRDLVARYHPSNLKPHNPKEKIPPVITAPNAERACEMVRRDIRKEEMFDCPEAQFSVALQNKDIDTLYNLLSSTWFGVPESTSCWEIEGFSICVDLLDDPPEE